MCISYMDVRVVVCAIIKKGGKYLFGQKPQNVGPYPNSWHFLGGGADLSQENVHEALRREVKEEAGIEITNIKRIGFQEDEEPDKNGKLTHYLFLIFEADYKSGKLKNGDDIAKLKLFTKSELKKIIMPRPSDKLFRQLGWIKEKQPVRKTTLRDSILR